MALITRRFAKVASYGNSLGLSLRTELLDMELDQGSSVVVELVEEDGEKTIIIRKENEEK